MMHLSGCCRKIIYLFCLGLLVSLSAFAADKSKAATVSPWLYKKLVKTEKLIAQKSYQAALESLQKILPDVGQGSYGQAAVLRSLSSVYALQGHYGKAIRALKKTLALNILPESQQLQSVLNLGQLYMTDEQYLQAIKTLKPWLLKNPNPEAYISVLLANAYAQLKQYRQALPHIKRAIITSKKPEESWYQLNLALYYELNDYQSAAYLLTKLLSLYPDKKEYWNQLTAVYQQLRQYQKALSIQHLAYKKGVLDSEKDLLALIRLFLYAGSPYKGAKLLSEALANNQVSHSSRNWETLATAWQQARELDKAIMALEKASRLSEKGRLYQRLGQIYVKQEKWQKAIVAIDKAIAKNSLKQLGATYLLLGMSHYELKHIEQARSAFKQAKRYRKQRKAAMQWLHYISAAPFYTGRQERSSNKPE